MSPCVNKPHSPREIIATRGRVDNAFTVSKEKPKENKHLMVMKKGIFHDESNKVVNISVWTLLADKYPGLTSA